ncbi:HlyD family efflux transporter periplasmic adaptor subunit [Lignipirellula cremea]|uniref:Coenzyme PQQ synthesis protein D n=1 Tax=Lignipirellula cremea TaxID=2528010 RepID=A0A518E4J5_9BACT|nr:HlyD family efflux transporter periplasmic adaptor subunit [Lignipirellula cremea]QDU98988.1 Coenzyme PQQ synthesis protein D [Lignipirellula cremea]
MSSCGLSSDRIAVRRRADLLISIQQQHGQTVYVLKDPLSLRYYWFSDYEHAIFQMLDGRVTVSRIVDRLVEDFPQFLISHDDVRAFIASLYRQSLVIGGQSGQGLRLKQRRDQLRRQSLKALLRNVLAIRCPGFDPTRLLNCLYPWTGWFFSRRTIPGVAVFAMIALCVLAANAVRLPGDLVAMHQYFGAGNWLLLALTLAGTKITHELGHAMACRRCGGECHEIGVMLLVLTPCLYCDVSDSWLLPNRWHRAAIAAAGMYVEVALASIAVLVWANTEPGNLHFLALQVMLISGVSTLLFNINPLARYDGYYILADIVDIPNLREEARNARTAFLWRFLAGVQLPGAPRRLSWKLIAFDFGVTLYRWVLLCSILWFLYQILSAQGLQVVWQYMAFTVISAAAVEPAWRLAKALLGKEKREQMKRRNVITAASVLAFGALLILLLPLPCYVQSPLELRAADAAAVYAPHSAQLRELRVQPGQQVAKGELLAKLQSVDLELAVARLESDVRSQELLLRSLNYERYENPQAAAAAPQAEELLRATKNQYEQRRRDLDRFQLTAPHAGVVLAPGRRQTAADQTTLASWSGSPLDPRNRHMVLAQGDVLCEIGDPHQLEAVLIVDQVDVEQLRLGQPVRAVLDAQPSCWLRGEVVEIARQKLDATPQSLTIQAGGGVASRVDDQGIERPISACYMVRVQMEKQAGLPLPGMRGSARICTGWRTIGSRAWETLARTFHFRL